MKELNYIPSTYQCHKRKILYLKLLPTVLDIIKNDSHFHNLSKFYNYLFS